MKKSALFRPKVENNPDNMLFRFSLAQALYDEGASDASIPHLERCASSRDDWMLPRILLGKALLANNETARAKHRLQEALQLAIEQRHDEPAAELRALLADL
ncbi:MAG: molecular chaperone DnaJ [Opitutales bacterium]|jgi:Flp pilus assembly protein TadD